MLAVSVMWMLAGCLPQPTPAESPVDLGPATAIEATAAPTLTPTNPVPMNPILAPLVEQAKADLAERLSVDPAKINVAQAESVTWSDSSLGCPEPDMMYMQVLTPGYLIVLEVDDTSFEYHAGERTEAFYCENPKPPAAGEPLDH